ncbi:hypothetical protein ABIA30_004432 [Mycobacterium sp. MAA66]|uniref:hypothetical protein n=1 Tax=Mycobacterium sp. MAA66 TaxID=3156297 RepID=UPI0035197FC8
MPDERSEDQIAEPEGQVAEKPSAPSIDQPEGIFSGYGLGSAALGVVAVIAVAVATVLLLNHRAADADRAHKTRVLQAAADWASVLINMNAGNVGSSVQKLHDGTVGQLNEDFETTVTPFTQVVQKLQNKTSGQIESVAIESLHHPAPGQENKPDIPPELAALATSTDEVLVVATSVSQNAGVQPTVVRWNLRLGVSDVQGKLLISKLEMLR